MMKELVEVIHVIQLVCCNRVAHPVGEGSPTFIERELLEGKSAVTPTMSSIQVLPGLNTKRNSDIACEV